MGNKGYQVQPNVLFWIRLKTLQSSNQINQILQISYMYTDMKLSIFQPGSQIAIQCNKEDFESVDKQELKFLKENGLYEACTNSKIRIEGAQDLIMKDIEFRKIARGQLLAAGKQVHLAKYALMRHMPKLHDFLHYRIFDIDSVRLVVERFKYMEPQEKSLSSQFDEQKKSQHLSKRADQEVWQDIHQMQFYYQHALNDN